MEIFLAACKILFWVTIGYIISIEVQRFFNKYK